ncbi:hypothetical protein A9Q99_00275 [Gammaproteobacteria bacterium 45_16_T64]|nr:hypothetical protein A9Q99_00275 [Gammaproteobacteria bacterium 45_16_T64]
MFKNLDYEWARFVMRHRCSTNFFYHLLSVILFWIGPVLFFVTNNWYFWILFFISGLVGGIGHIVGTDPGIDKREATSSPTAALMATYMVFRVIVGKYPNDIEQAIAFFKSSDRPSPIQDR